MSLSDADILSAVGDHLKSIRSQGIGVAVSGGGDSVALLHILFRWAIAQNVPIHAATVDHGLRTGSADEARTVARWCADLGVSHSILTWEKGPDEAGNLQDRARRARYDLLTDWAARRGLSTLALGHTADDQAETVLMRLARSAGVDGLSAMPIRRELNGVTLLRPLLEVRRDELRSYLKRNGLSWIEDPSNDDSRFERIRMREALSVLEPLGLTTRALTDVATNMAQAREALDECTQQAARDLVRMQAGAVVFKTDAFGRLPDEIARRLLVHAVQWIGGGGYPPRRDAVRDVLDAIGEGRTVTLAGCLVHLARGETWICREYNAVRDLTCTPGVAWDGKWQATGDYPANTEIRALGPEGLLLCPDWRETGCPRAVLLSTPALWVGEHLIAAPFAGLGNDRHLIGPSDAEEFLTSLLSH